MNLIGLVLTIVLMALISTVGYFYGGPAYTNSKGNAEFAKINDDINQISSALRMASISDVVFSSPEKISEDLIKYGILVDIPKLNGESYRYWGFKSRMPEKSSDITFLMVKGVSPQTCSLINKKYRNKDGYEEFTTGGHVFMTPRDFYFETFEMNVAEPLPLDEMPSVTCYWASDDGTSNGYFEVMAVLSKKNLKPISS